jgi:hypothetical protein
MSSRHRAARAKVSTTIASEHYEYLEGRVSSGKARSIAEALDQSIALTRKIENRNRLAAATSNYFNSLGSRAAAEERELESDLASAAEDIDFDREP